MRLFSISSSSFSNSSSGILHSKLASKRFLAFFRQAFDGHIYAPRPDFFAGAVDFDAASVWEPHDADQLVFRFFLGASDAFTLRSLLFYRIRQSASLLRLYGLDINFVPGKSCRKSGVLPLLADGKATADQERQ